MPAELIAIIALYSFGLGLWVANCVYERRLNRIVTEYDERHTATVQWVRRRAAERILSSVGFDP